MYREREQRATVACNLGLCTKCTKRLNFVEHNTNDAILYSFGLQGVVSTLLTNVF